MELRQAGRVLLEAIARGVFEYVASQPVIRGVAEVVKVIAERLRQQVHSDKLDLRLRRLEAVQAVRADEAREIVRRVQREVGAQGPGVEKAVEILTALPAGVASRSRQSGGRRVPGPPRSLADYERLVPSRGFRFSAGQRAPSGDYELLRPLGLGGFGEVWQARHLYTGAEAAIKICTEADSRTFVREAQTLGTIAQKLGNHPNIVRIQSTHLSASPPSIEFEYVEGASLHDWFLSFEGRPPADEIRRVMRGVLAGLAAAHREGVTHRDLKPDNVLLAADGAPKLIDFGLGRACETEGATAEGAAQSLLAGAGTPGWMAPEQEKGESGDARTDVHAAGLLWYRLAAGDLTLAVGPDSSEILARAGLPKSERAAIAKALAVDPRSRHADAGLFLAAIGDPERASATPNLERVAPRTPASRPVPPANEPRGSFRPRFNPFAFKDGEKASTPEELLSLARAKPAEATEFLYEGAFEKWLRYAGDDKLAQRAQTIRESCPDREAGLEEFVTGVRPFIFRTGEAARTVEELLAVLRANPREGVHEIYAGALEKWLAYRGFEDHAHRAGFIREHEKDRERGLRTLLEPSRFEALKDEVARPGREAKAREEEREAEAKAREARKRWRKGCGVGAAIVAMLVGGLMMCSGILHGGPVGAVGGALVLAGMCCFAGLMNW
ncbi:MAG: serine/threonine protein kinase [Planctomycetes bacterium]|nr:serine/threonine protein kinase [Planctomycetota bacterium]